MRRVRDPAIAAGLAVAMAAAMAVAACAGMGGAPSPDATFQRGVALGIFSRGSEEDIRPPVREVARLGAGAVSLIAPFVLRDVRSLDFYPEPTVTPSDASLRRAARLAHAAGLKVLLYPIVHVWELRDGEWRGTLEPRDWSAWFEGYGRVVLRYARLAQEEGIEAFSVGSELCSSEAREPDWRRLIAQVRAVYSGEITYSVNWDHRQAARFLDALDFVSMNAYFRLSEADDPTLAELERAWRPIVEEVDTWAASVRKPLVIAEVGYPSRKGAARDPWDYTLERPPDLPTQAALYAAFLRSWARSKSLNGVYFYLWWGEGGASDTGYTPRGKPAQEVLRAWFAGEGLQAEGAGR